MGLNISEKGLCVNQELVSWCCGGESKDFMLIANDVERRNDEVKFMVKGCF